MTQNGFKLYHRREGEPGRWYDRFRHYLELGPDRSVTRTYREVSNQRRARQGLPLLTSNASPPKVWRDRARHFDWGARAAAWDRKQRRIERQRVEHLQSQARALAPKAIQILEQIMDGQLKNPDGTLVEGQNCNQRRLAAEKVLQLAGIGDIPFEEPEDDDGKPEIIGLRICEQVPRDDGLDVTYNDQPGTLTVEGGTTAVARGQNQNSAFPGGFP